MSLLTAAEQRRRATLRRLLLALGALVPVVAATVILTLLVVHDGQPPSAPATPPGSQCPGSGSAAEPEAGIWTIPPVSAGPLILPQPSNTTRGIPTGFAHSSEGAISAAAHYAEASVGLDVDRARALGDVAGAPAYIDAPHDFVRAVRSARTGLGLSRADGPPTGAYLTFEAQAYRVADATPVRVDVAVLGRVDGAGPATQGQGRGGPTATSYTLVWDDGDWRLAGAGTSLSGPPPAPRSPQAYDEGWRDLAMG
jgi:hypothetical protein